MQDFSILFKIGGAGILLVVLDKVLTSSGKGSDNKYCWDCYYITYDSFNNRRFI